MELRLSRIRVYWDQYGNCCITGLCFTTYLLGRAHRLTGGRPHLLWLSIYGYYLFDEAPWYDASFLDNQDWADGSRQTNATGRVEHHSDWGTLQEQTTCGTRHWGVSWNSRNHYSDSDETLRLKQNEPKIDRQINKADK